jgi:hypothetical protein
MIDERDLMASGNPQPVSTEDREPVLDEWYVEEEYYHGTPHVAIGREARWHKLPGKSGSLRKEYRGYAEIGFPDYPANERRYSKVFEAHDEMDLRKVDAWATTNPMGAQHQEEIRQAVARSHRQHGWAAPSDIKRECDNLAADLLLAYRPWQVKHDTHLRRLEASAELRAQVAVIAEDIEQGYADDYRELSRHLSTLVSFVSDLLSFSSSSGLSQPGAGESQVEEEA